MAVVLQQHDPQSTWRKQVAGYIEAVVTQLATLPSASYTGSKTYDPASMLTDTQLQTTVTVTTAALGNTALASFSLDLQGITLSATVSAANTVTVTFRNDTGGTIDLGSGTLRARVFT